MTHYTCSNCASGDKNKGICINIVLYYGKYCLWKVLYCFLAKQWESGKGDLSNVCLGACILFPPPKAQGFKPHICIHTNTNVSKYFVSYFVVSVSKSDLPNVCLGVCILSLLPRLQTSYFINSNAICKNESVRLRNWGKDPWEWN